MVKEVKIFLCDVCSKEHKTLSSAKRCEAKCLLHVQDQLTKAEQLETAYDRPRLTAASIVDYVSLINVELKKMFPKIKGTILFVDNISIDTWSHDGRGKEDMDTGVTLCVDVTMKYTQPEGWFNQSHILDNFGIYTSSGGGTDSIMHYPTSTIFLDDLTLIKECFKFNNEARKFINTQISEMNDKFLGMMEDDSTIESYDKIIEELHHNIRQVNVAKANHIKSKYHVPAEVEYGLITLSSDDFSNIETTPIIAKIKPFYM